MDPCGGNIPAGRRARAHAMVFAVALCCARAAVAASQSVPRVRRRVFEHEWFVASGRGRLEETWAPRQESDSQVRHLGAWPSRLSLGPPGCSDKGSDTHLG